MFDQQKQGLPVDLPSRLHVYFHTRQLMGSIDEDSGVDNRTMLKALNQRGFCSEKLWPYDLGKFRFAPSPAAEEAGAKAKIVNYAAVRQDLDIMRGTLASGFPFLFGFSVYESFESEQVAATGRVPLPGPGERSVGGHDVVICGYDDSQQMFLLKNSWDGWGFNHSGYAWIPYAYATDPNLASDFWVINAIPGPSQPPGPGPTPSPQPLQVVFNLAFSRNVPTGGRIVFSAPVNIAAGQYDVVPHGSSVGGELPPKEVLFVVEARDPGQVDDSSAKQ